MKTLDSKVGFRVSNFKEREKIHLKANFLYNAFLKSLFVRHVSCRIILPTENKSTFERCSLYRKYEVSSFYRNHFKSSSRGRSPLKLNIYYWPLKDLLQQEVFVNGFSLLKYTLEGHFSIEDLVGIKIFCLEGKYILSIEYEF